MISICPTCGKPIGHCAENNLYPGGKESGWHTVICCVNRTCLSFGVRVKPRVAMKAKPCVALGFPVCTAIIVHPMYQRMAA